MAEHLFVYGTLRSGAPMHGLIEGRVRALGPAVAPGRLLDLGDFPALAPPAGADDRVRGELYRIEAGEAESLLDSLDRYEGRSFSRERVRVAGPDGPVAAWLYLWRGDPRGRRIVPGGDYLAAGSVPGDAAGQARQGGRS